MATDDTEESLHYDEHVAMFDEIKHRPLVDIVSERIVFCEMARALIVGNDSTATYLAKQWHKKWGR